MNTSLIAVVITYYPDAKVISNFLSYYDKVAKLIVIDNTDTNNDAFLEKLKSFDKVVLIKNGENNGIAASLNLAAFKAIDLGFHWLLTMDQDSSFTGEQLSQYLSCFEKLQKETTGMFGVNHEGKTFDAQQDLCVGEKKQAIITSGSIVNLDAFKKTGIFNESLFIDGVDTEYCYRLNQHGYDVLMLSAVSMTHNLGNTITVKNWHVGKIVERNLHAPVRIYYITRNYLLLIKRYKKDFPEEVAALKQQLKIKIKNGLLYDKNRWKVLKYFAKGLSDYYRGRFGKIKKS